MKRSDLVLMRAYGEAIAKAAKAALAADLRHEYEHNDTRVSGDITAGGATLASISASVSTRRLAVIDEQALLTYLQQAHPGEVETRLHIRNPQWLELWLTQQLGAWDAANDDPDVDELPALPDGTAIDSGGRFITASTTMSSHVKAIMEKVADGVREGHVVKYDTMRDVALGRDTVEREG